MNARRNVASKPAQPETPQPWNSVAKDPLQALGMFDFYANKCEGTLRVICRAEMSRKRLYDIMCDLDESRTYGVLTSKLEESLHGLTDELARNNVLAAFAAHIYAAGSLNAYSAIDGSETDEL